jgi:hypothetical protein
MSKKVYTAKHGGTMAGDGRVAVALSTMKVPRPTHEPRTDKVAVVNNGMPETDVKSKVVKVMW